MNTAFLLMAQYDGKAIIPIELVCRDYFSHLTPPKLVQKISAGEIAIPLVRIEASQKCAKGVHLTDLASYLDARVEAARREMTALTTWTSPPIGKAIWERDLADSCLTVHDHCLHFAAY
jgi:hypothetical protein